MGWGEMNDDEEGFTMRTTTQSVYMRGVMLQYKVPSAHNKGNILESWV